MITRPPESIQVQVSDVLSILKNYLGASIQAVHLFGSAVDGGLKPSSDIDLLVTVNSPLSESGRAALMRELLSVSAFPGTDVERRALEVTVLAYEDVMPWRYPARRQMQFGEWLRDDIAEGIFE
ncbi:nucleotidyltransferase domain-containing protein, partial [Escherichia coli]